MKNERECRNRGGGAGEGRQIPFARTYIRARRTRTPHAYRQTDIHARTHNTHARTYTHAHAHTHTHTHAHTRTQQQLCWTNKRTNTHAHTHTHSLSLTGVWARAVAGAGGDGACSSRAGALPHRASLSRYCLHVPFFSFSLCVFFFPVALHCGKALVRIWHRIVVLFLVLWVRVYCVFRLTLVCVLLLFVSTCVLFDMCTAYPYVHLQCASLCVCVCIHMSHLCVRIYMHADRYV